MNNKTSFTWLVETYRLPDVVAMWARERLEHEIVVARELARAVVCDGLRLQSVDGRWAAGTMKPIAFHGYPYVGYTALPGGPMSILRIEALNHLLAVVEQKQVPELGKLYEEFLYKQDFRDWLVRQNLPLPRFWFAVD
ncbi:MAG TPA: hypothetical protein VIU46_08030 [Gallionellaceae bacterium]